MSPNFHDASTAVFLFMLVATIAALAWSRRRPTLPEGIAVVVFTAFALYAARNIELFAIVVAPILAAELNAMPDAGGALGARFQRWLAERNRRIAIMEAQLGGHVWPMAAVLVALAIGVVQWRSGEAAPLGVEFDPKLQPVAATDFIARNAFAGNMFNDLGWGGYVMFRLWPGQLVFIDGQTDFYGEPLVREYLQVVELREDWQRVLERYSVGWVLFESDSPLVRALSATPGWRVAYSDSVASVLVRTP